jgi:hypothetical protein
VGGLAVVVVAVVVVATVAGGAVVGGGGVVAVLVVVVVVGGRGVAIVNITCLSLSALPATSVEWNVTVWSPSPVTATGAE